MDEKPKKRKSNFNPNPKPFKGFRPQGKPFGQLGAQPQQRQPSFTPYRAGPPRLQPKPEEDQHYWTAQQWEDWAINEYENNPDAQLPAWFIDSIEGKPEE